MDRQGHTLTGLRRSAFALACIAVLLVAGAPAMAASAFETAPPDPRAVTVKAKGDGRADDTDAIQRALDQAADSAGGGLVFLPSGRYRISRTLLMWPAVR